MADVKHGCCDCANYQAPTSKEPCKSCRRWSNWEDKAKVKKTNNHEVFRVDNEESLKVTDEEIDFLLSTDVFARKEQTSCAAS